MKELKDKLQELRSQMHDVEEAIQKEYNAVFEDCGPLQTALTKLESSSEYLLNEFGDISSCVDFDTTPFIADRHCLESYLNEYHHARVCWDSGQLHTDIGPSFVIGDDGNVYDEGVQKFIIQSEDYSSEEERNALIENYMEKSGNFPGVFHVSDYGCVTPVNTFKKGD